MDLEDIDKPITERINFAASKKREGAGTAGTDPVFWEGLWEGKIRALQDIREEIYKKFFNPPQQ